LTGSKVTRSSRHIDGRPAECEAFKDKLSYTCRQQTFFFICWKHSIFCHPLRDNMTTGLLTTWDTLARTTFTQFFLDTTPDRSSLLVSALPSRILETKIKFLALEKIHLNHELMRQYNQRTLYI